MVPAARLPPQRILDQNLPEIDTLGRFIRAPAACFAGPVQAPPETAKAKSFQYFCTTFDALKLGLLLYWHALSQALSW